jgi:hypothetical protein
MSSKKMGNQPPNGQSQDNTSKPGSGRTSKDLGHRDPAAEENNVNKSNTIEEEPEESSMFSGLDVNEGDGDRDNGKEEGSNVNELSVGENNEDGNDSSMFEGMNVGAEDATSPRGSAFDFISKSDPDVEIETSIINEENAEESAFSFLNKAKDTDESSDNDGEESEEEPAPVAVVSNKKSEAVGKVDEPKQDTTPKSRAQVEVSTPEKTSSKVSATEVKKTTAPSTPVMTSTPAKGQDKQSAKAGQTNSPFASPATPIRVSVFEVNSQEAELEFQLNELTENLNEYATRLQGVDQKLLLAANTRKELLTKLIKTQRAMKDVEKAEVKASKEENYEEAAELNQKIQSMKEDIASYEEQISDQEDLIIDLELEKKTIVREELKLRKAQQSKLTTLESKHSSILKQYLEKTNSQRSDHEDKIKSITDSIKKGLSHIELDEKILKEKESRMNESIEQQTKPFLDERNTWADKKSKVQAEIEELMEKLKAKQREEKEIDSNMQSVEDKITYVKSKFQKELDKLENEWSSIKEQRDQFEKDKLALEVEKKRWEQDFQQIETKEKQQKNLFQKIQQEGSKNITVISTLEHLSAPNRANSATLLMPQAKLKSSASGGQSTEKLRADLAEQQAAIKDLTSQLLVSQKQIISLKQGIAAINNDILPNLEKNKKVAVAGRQFKEASQFQKEIKDANTELAQQEVSLKELEQSVTTMNGELEQREEQLRVTTENLTKLESEVDMKLIEEFSAAIRTLRADLKEKKYKDKSEEQFMRVELESLKVQLINIKLKHDMPTDEDEKPEKEEVPEPKEEEKPVPKSPVEEKETVAEVVASTNTSLIPADEESKESTEVTVESNTIEIGDEDPEEVVEEKKEDEPTQTVIEESTGADPEVDPDQTVDGEAKDNTDEKVEEEEGGSSLFDGLAVDAEEEKDEPQPPQEEDPEIKRQKLLEDKNKELEAYRQQLKELEAKLQDVCEREDYDAAYAIDAEIADANNKIETVQAEIQAI